jgi:hypothetical protein
MLKNVADLLESPNMDLFKNLKDPLNQRLSKIYGIHSQEAKFFLDLEYEIDFFNLDYLKIYTTRTIKGVISGNYMMCSVKNGHVKALNLSNWGVNNLPKSIGLLSELKHLILKNNNLRSIPKSVGSLRHLRTLDLSNCNISSLPSSLSNLFKLKKFSLNQNRELKELPESVILLAKNNLSKKYRWQGVVQKEAFILAILEILTGLVLKKAKDKKSFLLKNSACHYKINENGNIIGIYVYHPQYSILNTIPGEIVDLEYLKELDLPNNNIIIIPESIEKLFSLTRLNLRNNLIKRIPDSLSELKKLNCLKLAGNRIKKTPEWVQAKLDKYESTIDLNGYKRYFFGIPIGEIMKRFPRDIELSHKCLE